MIGCSVLRTPFKYLGIPVGGNMNSIKAWDDIINKIKKRLSNWKLTLSIGGRLTLLKSVLGSTPLYYMSLYKVPKTVLHSMESIRRNFFNGIREGDRKISWISWPKDLNDDGYFHVKDVRSKLDDSLLPKADTPTRWIKTIPIKLNIFAWKVSLNRLPTRLNLVRRGVLVSPISCPICLAGLEDLDHLLFRCNMAAEVLRAVSKWWNLAWSPLDSYSTWLSWVSSIQMLSQLKSVLEFSIRLGGAFGRTGTNFYLRTLTLGKRFF
nr:RNA-directed DNA polymerase, eukaryota [Tanacetum cinerariifolium]